MLNAPANKQQCQPLSLMPLQLLVVKAWDRFQPLMPEYKYSSVIFATLVLAFLMVVISSSAVRVIRPETLLRGMMVVYGLVPPELLLALSG